LHAVEAKRDARKMPLTQQHNYGADQDRRVLAEGCSQCQQQEADR
jgi:hypothetical protein